MWVINNDKIILRKVELVAKAIVEAKMAFYHWIIRRDITEAKDWRTRSVIKGLVPYRECRFNELTEEDLGAASIDELCPVRQKKSP